MGALAVSYRLLPYLYTLFHESSVNGMPVMRPLFFADFKDLKLRKEQQAFLLGSDLMVIPKWAEYVAKPAGKWRTISIVGEDSKNEKYQPELKIRPGAIIPMGEIIQNTTEYNTDIITLIVSLDQNGKASGQMYVDAGEGFGYKNGEYALLNFEAKTINNKVIISIAKIEGKYNVSNKLVKVKLVTDKEVLTGESQSLNTIEIAL
jgi:alpha-glucosidase